MSWRATVALAFTAAAALAFSPQFLGCRLAYNATSSAPTGWYWVRPAVDLQVSHYVLARLPEDAAVLANDRQYLPRSVPLLKRIGAVAKQTVCLSGNRILIDGRAAAVTLTHDRLGRELSPWRQCRVLEHDEVFLLSNSSPASFDSRYFGPIRLSNVIGQAIPLWTW